MSATGAIVSGSLYIEEKESPSDREMQRVPLAYFGLSGGGYGVLDHLTVYEAVTKGTLSGPDINHLASLASDLKTQGFECSVQEATGPDVRYPTLSFSKPCTETNSAALAAREAGRRLKHSDAAILERSDIRQVVDALENVTGLWIAALAEGKGPIPLSNESPKTKETVSAPSRSDMPIPTSGSRLLSKIGFGS